jgi:hypothetical protein
MAVRVVVTRYACFDVLRGDLKMPWQSRSKKRNSCRSIMYAVHIAIAHLERQETARLGSCSHSLRSLLA